MIETHGNTFSRPGRDGAAAGRIFLFSPRPGDPAAARPRLSEIESPSTTEPVPAASGGTAREGVA